jgi:hypothetical protein
LAIAGELIAGKIEGLEKSFRSAFRSYLSGCVLGIGAA